MKNISFLTIHSILPWGAYACKNRVVSIVYKKNRSDLFDFLLNFFIFIFFKNINFISLQKEIFQQNT